jgi:hypothetical protein
MDKKGNKVEQMRLLLKVGEGGGESYRPRRVVVGVGMIND